jgi:predicted dehydrogenase
MIKAGIIGLGKMGISHCSIINAHPDIDLVSACDTSAMVLEVLKKYTSLKCYTDYKKMINECELECLFVATPTKFHYDMVTYALERGIHVFCEKPFSLTLEQGEKMVRLAKDGKLVNQVGYHNRFFGTFNFVKKLVKINAIGDIYHFLGEAYGPVVVKKKGGTWRTDSSQGGGCLFDYASHVINLIEFILGPIKTVNGTLLKRIFSKSVEDAVYSNLHLENGLSGLLSVNWSEDTYRKMSTQITIFGTEGKVISDAQELKINLKKENKSLGLEKGWNMRYITDVQEQVDFYLRGEEYSAQIDYFSKCIKEKNLNNINSFESAYATDEVIDLLLKNGNKL